QTAAIFDDALPLPDGAQWNAINAKDNLILARYPLQLEGYQIPGLPQATALIDLPDEAYGETDLYMICAHFKSGGALGDIFARQRQADTLIAQVRDFKTPGDNIDLPSGTPFILLGDFNVYDSDPAAHLTTMLTGDIDDEDKYGPDIAPDWDGTPLADALPFHNGGDRLTYTWRNDMEPFAPGPLDRILYSDSVLAIANAFVLNTMLLGPAELAALGLHAEDVMVQPARGNYDHLPIVVDFVLVEG
ncbi:MAG: endonuclease/exonuclease/phosphatase family protein, partial [Anaerolineae bacterium]|nr:endonuclease/exonuclease/phosphatase family protein [Anaerolineae bacterium]